MTGKRFFHPHRFFTVLALLALVMVLAAPAFSVSAQAGSVGFVNTGRLNVRSGPGIQFAIVTSIPFDMQVTLLGRAVQSTWVQVQLANGAQGWVNFLYLRSFTQLSSLPITWNQVVPPPANPNPTPGGPVVHVVRAGETLQIIARRYSTTWQTLAALNNLPNPNYIFAGQRLIVRGAVTQPPPTQPPPTAGIHVVQPGETLQTIARRYGTTWQTLAALNALPNPNYIFAGQRLIVPAAPAPAQTIHVVQAGEGLAQIAQRYGVSVQAIVVANGIVNPNLIFPGQRLVIPR